MAEITLESLAARVASLEKQLLEQKATKPEPSKDWLKTVGMFDDDPDFDREVLAEARALREAAREEALREVPE